ATLFGCDNITTWLEERTVVVAFICLAMLFSCSGAIILSLVATMYQVGFSRHAAEVGFALKIDPAVCGWAVTSRAFSSLVRSCAKSCSIPSGRKQKKPVSLRNQHVQACRFWEIDADIGDGLTSIGSEGSSINKSDHLGIVAGFRDDHAAVGVANQNHRTLLSGDRSPGRGYVIR